MKKIEYLDMERSTLNNKNYRTVKYTGKHLQLVFMTLKPVECIPFEVHDGDQFIRVESGNAACIVDGKAYSLEAGGHDTIIIPAGLPHHVQNMSNFEDLKLYALYAPVEHEPSKRDVRQPARKTKKTYRCYTCPRCGESAILKGACEICGWFPEED